MDKTTTERETRDFMNVDSFSQLPFIRPAPPIREKSGIRLFGIEFAGGDDSVSVSVDDSDSGETTTKNNQNNNNNNNLTTFDPVKGDDTTTTTTTTTATETNSESSRRFECHYCCRNFPTSQALGGHQNAHKRERQHAKRAHLQSTMVHGSTFSDAHHHVYNLMNYRFGSTPSTPPMPYPSWNNNTRFYGTTTMSFSDHNHYHNQHHQQQQPINGSPLAFWRTPNSNPSFSHERSTTLPPLFASEEITANMRTSQVVGASNSQNREHVSLDLHL